MYGAEVERRLRELILVRRSGEAYRRTSPADGVRTTMEESLRKSDERAKKIASQCKHTSRYTYAHMLEGQSMTTGAVALASHTPKQPPRAWRDEWLLTHPEPHEVLVALEKDAAHLRAESSELRGRALESNRANRARFRRHLGTEETIRENPHRPTWLTPKSAPIPPPHSARAPSAPLQRRQAHPPATTWRRAPRVASPRNRTPRTAWNGGAARKVSTLEFILNDSAASKGHPALRRPELVNLLYESKSKVCACSVALYEHM
ncbi:hypothetical protein AB1Y20_002264 [Prymnesium parvum]|uniref:Uncharacterized protein n=1 Tax=Prymnesium parvum TaxID=97485 RepID=A0AB34JAG7_PRYPA